MHKIKSRLEGSIRLVVILGCLSICTVACAQQSIHNQISANHQNVAGTKVSLVPPEGFLPSPTFSGFQQAESGSSIMVVEVKGPYAKVSAGFTEEGLKSKGIELLKKTEMQINGDEALLIEANQFAQGAMYGKYTFAFGNDDHTVILNAAYPKALAKTLAKDLKAALLTVVYQGDLEIDPLEGIPFSVDVAGTGLLPADMVANNLMFKRSRPGEPKSADNALLIATRSVGTVVVEDKKQYAANRIKLLSNFTDVKIEEMNEVVIEEMDGIEIIAYGKDQKSEKQVLIYQVMLFAGDQYYLVLGTASDDFPLNLKEFKQVSLTFKRKF